VERSNSTQRVVLIFILFKNLNPLVLIHSNHLHFNLAWISFILDIRDHLSQLLTKMSATDFISSRFLRNIWTMMYPVLLIMFILKWFILKNVFNLKYNCAGKIAVLKVSDHF